ncbi:uncharacterized protein C8A04DRAFT_23770 [Dichotomopilus funicola]|uniref:DNA replication checkpoint mediator MRC1 domain-containing protein n=1 Tax=Dichotomopilus funicola TaxID=1934379 RepID=A0AAN6VBD9_9PEZI|nr:hypothetical protein C8A04DRAFT_23770 [Dichotomopilus funicola]
MASSRSPSPSLQRSRSVSPTTATTRLIQQNRNQFAGLSDSSSSEEEDNGILRPRGRMAARMQVRGNENESSSSAQSENESEQENAGTIQQSKSPKKTTTTTVENVRLEGSNEGTLEEDDDEDEDVITMRRPRTLNKARRERTSTPETETTGPQPPQDAPASPGLFVSPSKPQSPSPISGEQSSDDEQDAVKKLKNSRFQALVAKKREERLAREAEEARKKAVRRQRAGFEDHDDGMLADDDILDDEDDNITDDEGGRRLTQEAGASRPARKASKKALEEMNRETQRLTRSLQLAHEAKVRKKISKATLFERFNFKPGGGSVTTTTTAVEEVAPVPAAGVDAGSSRPPTPGSVQQSDAEMKDAETPPSSPPTAEKEKAEGVLPTVVETAAAEEDEEKFPDLDELAQQAAVKQLDKGKGKATAADLAEQAAPPAGVPQKRNFRVKLPQLQANRAAVSVSLDDDLEVIPTRKSKLDAIFDRVPANQAKQANTLHILRRLAHLDDPDKRAAPPTRAGNKLKKEHQEVAMTTGELRASLLQRARQQAKLERDRHLEMLRAKGVHVQTAEEREREEQDVEDMVAKARREVEEIMDREREAAKAERKQRREAGEEDPLGWDDESDDEDYEEGADEGADEGEEKEIELSGSEDEEEGDEEDEDEEEGEGLIDDVAPVADESETGEDEDLPSTRQVRRRPRKQTTILSDDEDDVELPLVKATQAPQATPRPKTQFPKSPSVRNTESPSVPTSVLRSATKTFIPGLPVAGPAGLGLTQIFAGTMDDSQVGMGMTQASPSQPRPTFDDTTAFPDSNFSQTARESGDAADDLILDSQRQPGRETQQQTEETQGIQIRFSQSQVHGFDTFLDEMAAPTQMSDLLEPTQDGGFSDLSPLRHRFVERPASTIATVPVDRTQTQADEADEHNESPLVRRTGKLRRKADMVAPVSPSRGSPVERGSAGEDDSIEIGEFGLNAIPNSNTTGTTNGPNAWAAMKKAALKEKKRKEAFDKKKSKAREMVEEQAEESEDEYAGLGGADGEDSDDADDEMVKEMIDDETKENEGDERKLAAFYADRERADDEKRVEKLFHDVTTGQLRRKRGGGDWDDLDDSDDDGEARRRMKRRQFAKMQRTLYADERISKVAENPRNQAFMRTIEDRGSDDEMDFLFAPPSVPASESQSQSQSQSQSRDSMVGPNAIIPNSQPQTVAAAGGGGGAPITAPNPRRTKTGKKPSNIGEIRETLSNLLDEPFGGSVIPATELGSDDDGDDEENQTRPGSSNSTASGSSNKENHNPRRTGSGSGSGTKPAIIDRISLKRNASTASSASSKLAFAAAANPTTTTGTGSSTSASTSTFKVPALLRRATTNSLLSTSSSTSSTSTTSSTKNTNTTTTREGAGAMKIKKPAGKRSGVSYLARETERRAALAEAERRREAKKMRGAEGRGKVVGGLFGGGRFE